MLSNPVMRISWVLLLSLVFSVEGCSTPYRDLPVVEIGPYGCAIPSQSIVLNRTELTVASKVFGEFASGLLDYKHRPELIELISKASNDSVVVDYLLCNANKRGDVTTQEQRDHLGKRLDFMRGVPPPTSAQIAQWQEKNPFPPQLDPTIRMLLANQEQRLKEYQEKEKEREKEEQERRKEDREERRILMQQNEKLMLMFLAETNQRRAK